jgi:hypothetical protein
LSPSDFDSSGSKEAAERLAAQLVELRATLERVKQRRLEAGDWAVVRALLSELIEQAEPGQQWVTIELSDEEEESGRTNEAVGAEESKQ